MTQLSEAYLHEQLQHWSQELVKSIKAERWQEATKAAAFIQQDLAALASRAETQGGRQ